MHVCVCVCVCVCECFVHNLLKTERQHAMMGHNMHVL